MTCVFSRQIVARFVQLPDHDQIMHDWSLMIVAYLLNSVFCYSSFQLVSYRQHSSNLLGSSSSLGIFGLINLLASRFGQCFRQYEVFLSSNLFDLSTPFLSALTLKCFLEHGFLTFPYKLLLATIYISLGFVHSVKSFFIALK